MLCMYVMYNMEVLCVCLLCLSAMYVFLFCMFDICAHWVCAYVSITCKCYVVYKCYCYVRLTCMNVVYVCMLIMNCRYVLYEWNVCVYGMCAYAEYAMYWDTLCMRAVVCYVLYVCYVSYVGNACMDVCPAWLHVRYIVYVMNVW